MIADCGHFVPEDRADEAFRYTLGPAGDFGIFIVLIQGERDLRGVERCRAISGVLHLAGLLAR
jgi:hypothetical protein